MENLMVNSIKHLHEHGAITICSNGRFYNLFINNNGELMAELDACDSNISKKTTNKHTIDMILLNIFKCTLMDKKIDIYSYETCNSIDDYTKNQIINKMYSFYMLLLRDRSMLQDIIIKSFEGQSEAQIFNNILVQMGYKKTPKSKYSLDEIINRLEKEIVDWLVIYKYGTMVYKEMQLSYTSKDPDYANIKSTWENLFESNMSMKDIPEEVIKETTTKVQSEKKKKKMPSVEKKKELDVIALKKNHIAYEILNEREFITDPAIGRDKEIRDVGATLLTSSLSPIILGESGVGKTAIIEGLAYRIKNGLISNELKDKYILKISPSAIVSGCIYRGQFEERMQELISYLQSHKNVILYVDEVHTAYGTGSSKDDNNDMVNILKPYLENGSVRMICATTKREYEEYMMKDAAFTRRFKPVIAEEPSVEVLREIVKKTVQKNEEQSGLQFGNKEYLDTIINILILVTDSKHRTYKEKRYNPGLIISIIEEAFGYARYDDATEVSMDYLVNSLNKCENLYKTGREEAAYKLFNLSKVQMRESKIIEFKPKSNL